MILQNQIWTHHFWWRMILSKQYIYLAGNVLRGSTHFISFWVSTLARADLNRASRFCIFLPSTDECLRAKGGSMTGPENLRRMAKLGRGSSAFAARDNLLLWMKNSSYELTRQNLLKCRVRAVLYNIINKFRI